MGAFQTGKYRNVFQEIGKSREETAERLRETVRAFFDGEEKVCFPAGKDMAYIEDTGNHDVRTEGMSYGMMMCVQLDRKEDFDRLWKWAKTYMWMEDGENEGYFAWSCTVEGVRNAQGPAPDGEEFFAMALFFASHRWGDGEGIFRYSYEAKEILRACLHKGENGRPGKPMWNRKNRQVLFVPGSPFTDPSYHLPHFYELFAFWAYEEDRSFWKKAAEASRKYLAKACHPVTGMSAEYAKFNGQPLRRVFAWSGGRHDWFYSDAYRTAANIGLDYEWFGVDSGQRKAPLRLMAFLGRTRQENPFRTFEVDGTPLEQEALHPVALLATTAQGALAAGTLRQEEEARAGNTPDGYERLLAREWVERFWNQPMRTGGHRYYDNCLYLLAFLALSGNYRIWGETDAPKGKAPAETEQVTQGPVAPEDPKPKRNSFFLMRKKEVVGGVQPDGRGIQFLFLDDARLPGFAQIVGNIQEKSILELLTTAEGFRRLVSAIGVTLDAPDCGRTVDFVFQMYGAADRNSGTLIRRPIRPDGMERIIELDGLEWSETDRAPGQIRFEFAEAGSMATADVRLYLHDGFAVPEPEEEEEVDTGSAAYRAMIQDSLMQTGNVSRLKKVMRKAARGEEIVLAFIGGSLTQGAGATPIHQNSFARKTYQGFCRLLGADEQKVDFRKAGAGGTSSELGMIRYERDVLREGGREPDLVVVEFGVNDDGDETKGECYESLVRKILFSPNAPAVVLLFCVFANDWNLQERLAPIGRAYGLPMVSVKDAVTKQFYWKKEERILSKNQFFYDRYHPNNMGHTVIADCLLNLFREADREECQPETGLDQITPVIGAGFQNVKLFDRSAVREAAADGEAAASTAPPVLRLSCGSFGQTDENLQAVEMDGNFAPTKEFPYNWLHVAGEEPFRMKVACASLLLVYKDSGETKAGKAQVWVDGRRVLVADPRVNGWVHCNPVILFRGEERREHTVEIRMSPGEEEKEFTILGFGIV
jgi:endo-1,4-beta-D-glucanase Y